jgi:hypothetical protein
VLEYNRRKQQDELWRIYMSKLVSFSFNIPTYEDFRDGKVKKEEPEEALERIIDKINKANGGDDL